MHPTLRRSALATGLLLAACGGLHAQDLVYRPKNPAFGGETFNYNWLLSSAQAQDTTEDPDRALGSSRNNPLDDFAQNLNRQLLNQLSRQLVTTQFGERGLEEGTYTFGDFQVDIAPGVEGLTVTVFDASVGEQTQIVIPYF